MEGFTLEPIRDLASSWVLMLSNLANRGQPQRSFKRSRLSRHTSDTEPDRPPPFMKRLGALWADERLRTVALVNLAAVMERLDEQTLPSLYSAVSAAFRTSPTQLGYLTLCRALVQALSSPLGGVAGPLLYRNGRLLHESSTSACLAARPFLARVLQLLPQAM